jgi:hypothetical protein
MAYKIGKKPESAIEYLDELDGNVDIEDATRLVLRHADGNDELRVEQMVANSTYIYELEGVGTVRETPPTPKYLEKCAKTWAVLEECNILDEDDTPLFKKGMEWREFQRAWAKAGEEVRNAIFKRVVKVNPHWGFPIGGGSL